MTVKVFQTNKNGKIEFTRAELEKLLNEVYSDGYKAGEAHMRENYWTWSPSLTTTTQTLPITYRNTVDCTTGVVDGLCADKVSTQLDYNKADTAIADCAKSALATRDYPEAASKVAMVDCTNSSVLPLEGTITGNESVTGAVSNAANNSTSATRSVLFTPTQVVDIKGTSLSDAVEAILNTAFSMPATGKKSDNAYDKLARELSNL